MYTAFSVDRERVDPSYLLRFLKSPLAIAQYPQLGRGAVHRRMAISLTALGSLEITIPPLGEQRRTVALLDATDTLLARHRAMQLGLRKLTLSVFRRMFDGVASTELSELVEEFRYGTSNKSGPRGYPTLRIPNILGGAVNVSETKLVQVSDPELKRLSLREGDLLFVRTNGNPDNVGRSAVFSRPQGASADYGDRPWIYASYLIRARLTGRVLPAFVATYLATEAGRRQLRERSRTSAGQYNINAESLASIQVPLPPLADQQTFAARAGAIAAQRLLVERALAKDEELFASLQHRAFSGML